MAKITERFERLFKSLGVEMTQEQKDLLAKNVKLEIPDDLANLFDEVENNGLVSYKNNVKRTVLDEEDNHLAVLKETLGEDRFNKIKGAKGKAKFDMIKASYNEVLEEQKTAQKALIDAKKSGDSSDIADAKQELDRLKLELDSFKELKGNYDTLLKEKETFESTLSQKDNAIFNAELKSVIVTRSDLQDTFKKPIGSKLFTAELESRLAKEGKKLDLANDKLLTLDGKVITKGGVDFTATRFIGEFIDSNDEFKKLSGGQPAVATVSAVAAGSEQLDKMAMKLKEINDKKSALQN